MPDTDYMDQALALAARGIALASPNPRVGAVVVKDGQVVGEGLHVYDDKLHAEVIALLQAGERARGATLYINLEPCCHSGRTTPCTDAILRAGIRRVVAAMQDPNPAVSGRGFALLRQAGVEVALGCRQAAAQRLNQAFAKWIQTRLPYVTLKAGMTLDGKIAAPPSSQSDGTRTHEWITSEEARWHVQQLRHEHDAVLVGVGTVLADNPLLTDRTGLPRRRPLLRVVLDSKLRLPLDSRLVQTAREDVVVLCSLAETHRRAELERAGVRVEQIPPTAGRPDIHRALARIGGWEITSLIVEGGSLVNWILLSSHAVDRVFLYYAPKILAGPGAVPLVGGVGFPSVRQALTLREMILHRFGPDFAVEGYLTDVYAPESAGAASVRTAPLPT